MCHVDKYTFVLPRNSDTAYLAERDFLYLDSGALYTRVGSSRFNPGCCTLTTVKQLEITELNCVLVMVMGMPGLVGSARDQFLHLVLS